MALTFGMAWKFLIPSYEIPTEYLLQNNNGISVCVSIILRVIRYLGILERARYGMSEHHLEKSVIFQVSKLATSG